MSLSKNSIYHDCTYSVPQALNSNGLPETKKRYVNTIATNLQNHQKVI